MNAFGGHIILTGATGYIGQRFLNIALQSNCQVTILSRRPVAFFDKSRMRWFKWSLGEGLPDGAFQTDGPFMAPTAIVHLAHAWHDGSEGQSNSGTDDLNISGMKQLIEAARIHQIPRFVFASSMVAREDALNVYGRTKYKLEQLLQEPEQVAARIGLVYGGPQAGLWGTLCRLVRLTPILPMVGSDRLTQPIHIDDLSDGLFKLATKNKLDRRVYRLADPAPVPFRCILQLIANQTFGHPLVIVPISFSFVMKVLDVLEHIPLVPQINRERLLGLSGVLTSESRDDLESLGLGLRPLAESLSLEHPQRRRLLLREGKVLLGYLTGKKPAQSAIRRYVRGIIAYGDSRPIRLPFPAVFWPPLLRLFDPLPNQETLKTNDDRDTLEDRINIALKIAETTPAGASHLYDYKGTSKFKVIIELVYTLTIEAIIFPLRLVSGWSYR